MLRKLNALGLRKITPTLRKKLSAIYAFKRLDNLHISRIICSERHSLQTNTGTEATSMCRNIKNLFNFDPPVTDEEIRNASLQFVRKISGFNKPSKANEAGFNAAIEEVASASTRLLRSLETNAPPKNREEEAEKLKARAADRFGAGA
jgi:hypothetical protein